LSPPANLAQVPSSRGYRGGFSSRLMVKDLSLVLRAAEHCSAPTPLTEQARGLYEQVGTTGGSLGERG